MEMEVAAPSRLFVVAALSVFNVDAGFLSSGRRQFLGRVYLLRVLS
jgi:hypothetical protein